MDVAGRERYYFRAGEAGLFLHEQAGDAAELALILDGRDAPSPHEHTPTKASANLWAVMGVTVFCEIRIPIPGPVDAAIIMEMLSELERLLQ